MLELVFIFCSDMCNFIEALCPDWSDLEQAMASVHTVVHGLVKFSKVGVVSCKNLNPVSYFSISVLTLLQQECA